MRAFLLRRAVAERAVSLPEEEKEEEEKEEEEGEEKGEKRL